MRRRLAIFAALLLPILPAGADVAVGTPVVRGVLISVVAGIIRVQKPDDRPQYVPLSPGAVIVVAKALPRTSLTVGETVAVNADDVAVPHSRLLVAGIYVQADSSVAPADRERVTREFLPASGVDPEPHVVISGRLLAAKGTWIEIGTKDGVTRVELMPEARGQRVRIGQLSDLRQGETVTVTLPHGSTPAVLVEH